MSAGVNGPARQPGRRGRFPAPPGRRRGSACRPAVRTFTRRFRDETGTSPRQWLLRQRVAHARLLLESTDLSVDAVERRCGLGSATALRQHFQQSVGVAPSAYRRTFRHP